MKQLILHVDTLSGISDLSFEDAGKLFQAMLGNKISLAPPLDVMLVKHQRLNSNDIAARKVRFKKELFTLFPTKDLQVLKAFTEYWTEHNDNGKKMRFEMEKVFNKKRRMDTWERNNFSKSTSGVESGDGIILKTRM
jgi:hypothetical protein